MSITIDTAGAQIAVEEATIQCNQIHSIHTKHKLINGTRHQYVEIETSGGEIEVYDLPQEVIDALMVAGAVIRD